MEFQKEYEILKSLNSDQILEISFNFQSHKIKIYFHKKENHEFLILICENQNAVFVKNYGIYFVNGSARISGYWGKYHFDASGLANPSDKRFNEFYLKMKESIQSIKNNNDEFKISYLQKSEGLKQIKTLTSKSKYPKDSIYFTHVRRISISPKQYKKVSDLLGKDVADYLKSSGLTVVFSPDITKQKVFILREHE